MQTCFEAKTPWPTEPVACIEPVSSVLTMAVRKHLLDMLLPDVRTAVCVLCPLWHAKTCIYHPFLPCRKPARAPWRDQDSRLRPGEGCAPEAPLHRLRVYAVVSRHPKPADRPVDRPDRWCIVACSSPPHAQHLSVQDDATRDVFHLTRLRPVACMCIASASDQPGCLHSEGCFMRKHLDQIITANCKVR